MTLNRRMAGSQSFAQDLVSQAQSSGLTTFGLGEDMQGDGYEIAGLMPLPTKKMARTAERLRTEAGRGLRQLTGALTGRGRAKAADLRRRSETIKRVRSDWDPLRSQDRELENRFKGIQGTARSRPADPEFEAERLANYGRGQMLRQDPSTWMPDVIQGGAGFPDEIKQLVFQQYDKIMQKNNSGAPLTPHSVPTLRVSGFDEGNKEYAELYNRRFTPQNEQENLRRRLAELERELREGKGRRSGTRGAGGGYTQGDDTLGGTDANRPPRYGNLAPTPLVVPGVGHQFEGI